MPQTYPGINNSDSLFACSEVERGEEYIDRLHTKLRGEEHPLAQLMRQCLHNSSSRSPSAEEMPGQLEEMNTQIHNPHEHLTNPEMVRILTVNMGEVREKENEKHHLQQQLWGQREQLDVSGDINDYVS